MGLSDAVQPWRSPHDPLRLARLKITVTGDLWPRRPRRRLILVGLGVTLRHSSTGGPHDSSRGRRLVSVGVEYPTWKVRGRYGQEFIMPVLMSRIFSDSDLILKYDALTPRVFDFPACERFASPSSGGREEETQEEAIGAVAQLLLHGRQVPRLLQDYHRLLPCPDCRVVRRMLHRPLPTHRRKGQADGG